MGVANEHIRQPLNTIKGQVMCRVQTAESPVASAISEMPLKRQEGRKKKNFSSSEI